MVYSDIGLHHFSILIQAQKFNRETNALPGKAGF